MSQIDDAREREPGRARIDRGFTLAELLIVIVLLGIVSTVVIFAVRGVTAAAEENVCRMDERILQTALLAYDAATPGAVVPNERELVRAGYLREASPNFDIDSAGGVFPHVGGPNGCESVP